MMWVLALAIIVTPETEPCVPPRVMLSRDKKFLGNVLY